MVIDAASLNIGKLTSVSMQNNANYNLPLDTDPDV